MNKYNNLFVTFVFLLSLPLIFWYCSSDDDVADRDWQLVWQDEFEGAVGQSPDVSKWVFDVGTGWGNNQLEFDTDRTENVSLDGEGNLAITTRKENFSGAAYTSGRISTRGLFAQTYGKFEARLKLPIGRGLWPAFWMVGTECDLNFWPDNSCCNGLDGWPQCGEIDIMEFRGQEPTVVHGTVHGPGYSGENPVTGTYEIANDRFDLDFHTFSIEWGEDFIDYFVDDIFYQRITPDDANGEWVFDHDYYIILNIAVGGGFVGPPNQQTIFPQTMLVDYIKVYEQVN